MYTHDANFLRKSESEEGIFGIFGIFTAFSPLGGPRCPHKKKKSEEGMIYQLIAKGWCYYDQRDKTMSKA